MIKSNNPFKTNVWGMAFQYSLSSYWLQEAALELRTNVFHNKMIWKMFLSQAGKLLIGHMLLVTNQVTTFPKNVFMCDHLPNAYEPPSELTLT